MPRVGVLWLRRLRFLLGTVSCDWCDGIKRVGLCTRLSIDEAILVTLLKNTHLKYRGGESSMSCFSHSWANVPGSESSWERKFHLWHVTPPPPGEGSGRGKFFVISKWHILVFAKFKGFLYPKAVTYTLKNLNRPRCGHCVHFVTIFLHITYHKVTIHRLVTVMYSFLRAICCTGSAYICYRPSVCPSVSQTGGSYKNGWS